MLLPRDIRYAMQLEAGIPEVYSYIWLYEHASLPEVQRARSYLEFVTERFTKAYSHIENLSTKEEMLLIAWTAYVMNSWGLLGNILECGCFKGATSACLSLVCEYFGTTLYVADSFQGLPPPNIDDGDQYKPGQFTSAFEETFNNIANYGSLAQVKFIKGYFSDTLKNIQIPNLSILWMDVDLYSSVLDVLTPIVPQLRKTGIIFSHEFGPNVIHGFKMDHFTCPSLVGKAMSAYFGQHKINYTAKWLYSCTAAISFHQSIVKACDIDISCLGYFRFPSTSKREPDISSIDARLDSLIKNGAELYKAACIERSDLMRIMNISNETTPEKFLLWAWRNGQYELATLAERKSDLKNALKQLWIKPFEKDQSQDLGYNMLIHAIWATRPDLHVFDPETAEGRKRLTNWFHQFGVNEYSLRDIISL